MSQVSYGTITITDMTDIERIYVEYCRSTSNQLNTSVTPPVVPNITVAWSENTPPWVNGQYIWQRSVVKKSGSTDLIYGTPVCLTGAAGSTGAAGRGLTATTTKYCNYNTGTPADNYSGWVDAPPSYDSSKPNYWVKITNTYSAAPTSEVIKYKDEALTKAVADAAIANSIAQQTIEDSQGAMSQANLSRYEINALNVRTKNFFKGKDNTYDGWFASGRATDEGLIETDAETYYYNARFAATNIALGYNKTPIINLDGGSGTINIYRFPTINSSTKKVTTAGSLGMQLSATDLNFYNTNGVVTSTFGDSISLASNEANVTIGSTSKYHTVLTNSGMYFRNGANTTNSNLLTITGNAINLYKSNTGTATVTINSSGKLTASDVDLTGIIKATSGFIGQNVANGFTISNSAIYNPNTKSTLSSDTVDGIYLGKDGIALGKGLFKVTSAGALTAKSGTIGGWNIDSTGLRVYSDNSGNTTAANALYYFYIASAPGTNGGNYAVGLRARTAEQQAANDPVIGNATVQFGLSHAGKLYAKNADITGVITATSFEAKSGSTTRAKIDANGLQVYDSSGTEIAKLGNILRIGKESEGNLLAQSSGIVLRDGLTEVATFEETEISLGKNSTSSTIRFCNNHVRLQTGQDSATNHVSASLGIYYPEAGEYGASIELGPSSVSLIGDPYDDGSTSIINLHCGTIYGIPSVDSAGYDLTIDRAEIKFLGSATFAGTSNPRVMVQQIDSNDTKTSMVWMGVGTGGMNHGVYSACSNKWMIYMNGANSPVCINKTTGGYINLEDLNNTVADLEDGFDNLGATEIDSGYETVGTIAQNSYADVTVSFSRTFWSAPYVTATLVSSNTSYTMGNVSISVFDITRTGFKARVYNARASMSPAFNWIAVI